MSPKSEGKLPSQRTIVDRHYPVDIGRAGRRQLYWHLYSMCFHAANHFFRNTRESINVKCAFLVGFWQHFASAWLSSSVGVKNTNTTEATV